MSPQERVDSSAERVEPTRPEAILAMLAGSSAASCRGRVRGLLASVALLSDSTAPARAREALRDIPELEAIRDDASLVISELVTNAVKHSGATDGDRIILSVVVDGDQVKIQVRDPARTDLLPQLGDLSSQGTGGLGLRLVSQIARRWDTECGNGRTVWAELALGDAATRRKENVM
jgi:anti-sigma regulatory factor (Ser/Thr protein kinase)